MRVLYTCIVLSFQNQSLSGKFLLGYLPYMLNMIGTRILSDKNEDKNEVLPVSVGDNYYPVSEGDDFYPVRAYWVNYCILYCFDGL